MLPAKFEVRGVYIFHTTKHEASFALLDFFLIFLLWIQLCVSRHPILPSPPIPPKCAEILTIISQNVTLLRGSVSPYRNNKVSKRDGPCLESSP